MSVLLQLHAAVVDALDAAEATHILVNAKILQETDHNISTGSRSQTLIAATAIRQKMSTLLYGFPVNNMPGDEDAIAISTVTDQPLLLDKHHKRMELASAIRLRVRSLCIYFDKQTNLRSWVKSNYLITLITSFDTTFICALFCLANPEWRNPSSRSFSRSLSSGFWHSGFFLHLTRLSINI